MKRWRVWVSWDCTSLGSVLACVSSAVRLAGGDARKGRDVLLDLEEGVLLVRRGHHLGFYIGKAAMCLSIGYRKREGVATVASEVKEDVGGCRFRHCRSHDGDDECRPEAPPGGATYRTRRR